MVKAFLDHFREGSVEAKVVEVIIVYCLLESEEILLPEGIVAVC